MNRSFEHILDSFRQLWVNRSLESNEDPKKTVLAAIEADLKDEFSHPRVRVTPYQKFHFAVRRVLHSSIPEEDKLTIIHLYEEELTKLTSE